MQPLVTRLATIALATTLAGVLVPAHAADAPAVPPPAAAAVAAPTGVQVRSLKEFGPTATPQQAEATYKKALAELAAAGGGFLSVPEDVPTGANLENVDRWSHSVNPPSGDLRDWKVGPGVTVIDNRAGTLVLRVPQVGRNNQAGITIERTLRLPPGDSLTHWTEESVLNIENTVIHGPCNYMEWIPEPVKAGKDARFYVPTVRNLFKGMFLNASEGPGYAGKVDRMTVKDIGYDKEKKLYYFTADTIVDHVAGTIVQNKSHTPLMRMVSRMNAANQTFDIYNHRYQYANGDSYMFDATFNYMDNVHSMPGDENGICYVAYIRSDTAIFRGKVRSYDAAARKLAFKDPQNAVSLSNTRPLINLNEKKWVTAGKVIIVPPANPVAAYETDDDGQWKFEGKSYPSEVVKSPITGPALRVGGLIRGDKDCPWDQALVGRFFAVDTADEYVGGYGAPAKLRRWYEITGITVRPDGTKDMTIKRYWWGAKSWGSPTLYNPENYTRDGHIRPLAYIIAPGVYVNDVSEAVNSPKATLGLAPGPDTGTPADYAADDPVEQAIGPDPFKPQGFRAWCFDSVPGLWPSALVDLANHGDVARSSAITIQGGGDDIQACIKDRKDHRAPFDTGIRVDSACGTGIEFNADAANAAILFKQPHRDQVLKWLYGPRMLGMQPAAATLAVNAMTGVLTFTGGSGAKIEGSVTATGLSGDDKPARNLRGKNVPVKVGETTVAVTFPLAEVDADYAVFVEQTWIANRAVVKKDAAGFTVQFEKPAPADATLDWMLVR